MNRSFDLITFDCYGTLIDWEAGIATAFAEEAGRRGQQSLDRDALLRLHHEIEPSVQAGSFQRYRNVLTSVAARITERLGWPAGDDTFLAESLPGWQPFPDTNAVLAALRARGYRLGILSNVDRDLIERTITLFPTTFDLVITAEDVRSYKPAEGHFLEAKRQIGPERWVHAAQSWFHDVVPARRHGIAVVWVNRKNEPLPGDVRPTGVVGDLGGLQRWLES